MYSLCHPGPNMRAHSLAFIIAGFFEDSKVPKFCTSDEENNVPMGKEKDKTLRSKMIPKVR